MRLFLISELDYSTTQIDDLLCLTISLAIIYAMTSWAV